MNKKVSVGVTAAFIFIAVAITFTATFIYSKNLFDSRIVGVQERAAMYDKISEIDSAVRQNFCGEIDDEKIQDGMANGYIAAVSDAHTRYLTARELSALNEKTAGKATGVGLYVEQNESGFPVVKQVMEDSSAEKMGIQTGDILVEVNNLDCLVVGFTEVENMLYGTEGEQLIVTFTREGEEKKVTLVYTEFERKSINDYVVNGYLYLRFTDFNVFTASQLTVLTSGIFGAGKDIEAFVIDLRNLDGGFFFENVEGIIKQLMPAGELASLLKSDGSSEAITVNESAGNLSDIKAVVLVNEKTIGYAELLAADLGSRDDVVIVGVNSAGVGSYQKFTKITDGSGVFVSVAKLLGYGGISYDGEGVVPDFIAQSADGFVLADEAPNPVTDIQLRKALEVLDSGLI